MGTSTQKYPKSRRLTGKRSFQRFFQGDSIRVKTEWLNLAAGPNPYRISRFGVTISAKAKLSGVTRNRWKRWLKEAFRQNQDRFPGGWDFLASITRPPIPHNFQETQKELIKLLEILNLQKK